MQVVEPMKPMFKAPGTSRLKLNRDKLSSIGFKLYFWRYTEEWAADPKRFMEMYGSHPEVGRCRLTPDWPQVDPTLTPDLIQVDPRFNPG